MNRDKDAFMLPEHLMKYYLAVRTLAKERSTFVFPNSSHEHAAIVLSTIIDYSKEVKLYDDSLNGDIADKNHLVEEAIKKLVEDERSLKIVVRNDGQSQSSIYAFLCKLSREHPRNIKVSLASKEFKKAVVGLYSKDINFAVGDNTSYRTELAGYSEVNDRRATCSFNGTKEAKKLNDVFDSYYETCEPLNLNCN